MLVVFERFTGQARQVVTLAEEAVRSVGERAIDTNDILIGLLRVEAELGERRDKFESSAEYGAQQEALLASARTRYGVN